MHRDSSNNRDDDGSSSHEDVVLRLGKASNVVCHLVRDAECHVCHGLTLFVDAARPVSGVDVAHCVHERVSDLPVYVTLRVVKTGIVLTTNVTRALDTLRAHLSARRARHARPAMTLERDTLLRIDVDLTALSQYASASSAAAARRIELCRANEVIVGVCTLSLVVVYVHDTPPPPPPQQTPTTTLPPLASSPPPQQQQQQQQQQQASPVSRRLSFDAAPASTEHTPSSRPPRLPPLTTLSRTPYGLCVTATPHNNDRRRRSHSHYGDEIACVAVATTAAVTTRHSHNTPITRARDDAATHDHHTTTTPVQRRRQASPQWCEDDVYAMVTDILSRSSNNSNSADTASAASATLAHLDLARLRACVCARYAPVEGDDTTTASSVAAAHADKCDVLQHHVWAATRQHILTRLLLQQQQLSPHA